MGCSDEWDTVNERGLYHPSCKKGGEFRCYRLAGCAFPSKREVATPRGLAHRSRLGVRNDPHFVERFSSLKGLGL